MPGCTFIAFRGLFIALQQGIDVVGAEFRVLREMSMTSAGSRVRPARALADQRQVRRDAPLLAEAARLSVCEGRREAVRRVAGRRHVAERVSRPRLVFLAASAMFVFAVANASRLRIATRFNPVTGRAGLTIDLKATLQLVIVVGAERPRKRPVQLDRLMDRVLGCLRGEAQAPISFRARSAP